MADSKLSGEQISLIRADGEIKTGPIENAQKLIDTGSYRFLTPEEAEKLGMRTQANLPLEQAKNFG